MNDDDDSSEPETYTYSLTVQVTDGNGDPGEGETVIEDHEAIELTRTGGDHRVPEQYAGRYCRTPNHRR